MPEIIFNGVRKVYQGTTPVKRLYAGSELVWKERRTVTGRFFSYISYFSGKQRTLVSLNRTIATFSGIKPTDITHYVGKSGAEYPITLTSFSATYVDIPQGETYTANENHTLILRDYEVIPIESFN